MTHGGPIRTALATALGRPPDELRGANAVLANCAVVRIAVQDGVLQAVD